MVSYSKALMLVSVSTLVGEIAVSSSGCVYASAENPLPLVFTAPPELPTKDKHSASLESVKPAVHDVSKTPDVPTKGEEKHDDSTEKPTESPKESTTPVTKPEGPKERVEGRVEYSTKTVKPPRSILKVPTVEGQLSIEEVLKKRVRFQDEVKKETAPKVVGYVLKKDVATTSPDSKAHTPTSNTPVPPPMPEAKPGTSKFHVRLVATDAAKKADDALAHDSSVKPNGKLHVTMTTVEKPTKTTDGRPPVPPRNSSLYAQLEPASSESGKFDVPKTEEGKYFATFTPVKGEKPVQAGDKKSPTYTSFGYGTDDDFYTAAQDHENTYEDIHTGAFVDEHTPAGYSDFFYAEPYDTPKVSKSVYRELADTSKDALSSLKESTKKTMDLASKRVKGAAHKTAKESQKAASSLKEESQRVKNLVRASAGGAKRKIQGAAHKVSKETSKLGTTLNEDVRSKLSEAKDSTTKAVKSAASKTKQEAVKLGGDIAGLGKDMKAGAHKVGKTTKSKLQGAAHKTSKELTKFANGLKKRAQRLSSPTRYYRNSLGKLVTDDEISRM